MAAKTQIGDTFKLSFSGAGLAEGAKYEVYHVTGTEKSVPNLDPIVYLKLTGKSFYQLGVPFTVNVPESKLGLFFTETFGR